MEDFGILEQIVPADFPLSAKIEQRQVKDDTEYEKVYSTIIQYNKTRTTFKGDIVDFSQKL